VECGIPVFCLIAPGPRTFSVLHSEPLRYPERTTPNKTIRFGPKDAPHEPTQFYPSRVLIFLYAPVRPPVPYETPFSGRFSGTVARFGSIRYQYCRAQFGVTTKPAVRFLVLYPYPYHYRTTSASCAIPYRYGIFLVAAQFLFFTVYYKLLSRHRSMGGGGGGGGKPRGTSFPVRIDTGPAIPAVDDNSIAI
jgi:hypothetical protein